MTMKPLADRVLIKVEKDQEEKTAGGLVLATKTPAGVPAKGKVVACGEGKYAPNGTRVPMQVKVGDTVLISQGAGQKIKLDGEELVLVYESEILGIAE
ncbi:co-chaperone GroES [uncultured Ruminococcus sp.]|uniref:co-chaperone GroES n=1 Tax=uncultured Ruminococcus sp. TaxID=165186 RepID=UPI0026392648|nr:co-chaperone GroES [uncultured Ruminococcus sp.]